MGPGWALLKLQPPELGDWLTEQAAWLALNDVERGIADRIEAALDVLAARSEPLEAATLRIDLDPVVRWGIGFAADPPP